MQHLTFSQISTYDRISIAQIGACFYTANVKNERLRDGCVYVYQVTGKTYNSEKRYFVEDRKCIGKMINDTEMNPNENYFEFYDDAELREPEILYPEMVKIAMPLLVQRITQDLQLQELLSSIHGTEKAALIEDLITYMITKQTSVMQHYDSFAYENKVLSAESQCVRIDQNGKTRR